MRKFILVACLVVPMAGCGGLTYPDQPPPPPPPPNTTANQSDCVLNALNASDPHAAARAFRRSLMGCDTPDPEAWSYKPPPGFKPKPYVAPDDSDSVTITIESE